MGFAVFIGAVLFGLRLVFFAKGLRKSIQENRQMTARLRDMSRDPDSAAPREDERS